MDILCVGYASYDIFLQVDGFIKENHKYTIHRRTTSGGGPAFNAAYLLGCWGSDVGYLGQLGNDDYGDHMAEELKNAGVESLVVRRGSTSVSTILVNQLNGSRTILNYKEPRELLRREDLPKLPIADVVLFDGHEGPLTVALMKEMKSLFIYDAGSVKEQSEELLRHTDYVVASEVFATNYFELEDPLEQQKLIYLEIQKQKAKGQLKPTSTFVITLGSRGLIYEEAGTMKHLPAPKVKAVDTTGAGDFFHGAFAHAIQQGSPLLDALHRASSVAAHTVTHFGTREALATLDTVL